MSYLASSAFLALLVAPAFAHATRSARENKHSAPGGAPPVVDLKAPPMGFMSWEMFRCEVDCKSHPKGCIDENLFKSMADAMVEKGYLAAGYDGRLKTGATAKRSG